MRKKHASDISPEKFEDISLLLPGVRRRTKPATVDLYEVFWAVLYLLRTGCQWRFLPSDSPKWQTVYSYFAKWGEPFAMVACEALGQEVTVQISKRRELHKFAVIPKRWVLERSFA